MLGVSAVSFTSAVETELFVVSRLKFCIGVVGAGGVVCCFPVSLPCNISMKLVIGSGFNM